MWTAATSLIDEIQASFRAIHFSSPDGESILFAIDTILGLLSFGLK